MFVTKKKYLKLEEELLEVNAELFITSTMLSRVTKQLEELKPAKKTVAKKATAKKADK